MDRGDAGMSGTSATPAAGATITVHVPLKIRKYGGRKLVIAPDGGSLAPASRIDNTLVKALARAHRWKKMLEDGHFSSIAELATAEKINSTYLSRILKLTLLAPDIVEAILDGRQPPSMTLKVAMEPFSAEWDEQRREFAQGS
jgi:hypothetical protein